MVIGLFALAGAMIIGGLVSIIYGWDIVMVERGWTMVIAGTIGVTSGFLMIGVAAIVSHLSKLQSGLNQLNLRALAHLPEPPEPSAAIASRRLSGDTFAPDLEEEDERKDDDNQATLPLFPPMPSVADRESRDAGLPSYDEQFDLDEPIVRAPEPRDQPAEADERSSGFDVSSLKLPDFLLERGRKHSPEPKQDEAVDDFLRDYEPGPLPAERPIVEDEPEISRSPEPEPLPEPEPVYEPEPQPEPVEDDHRHEPETTATVIGTYNSGDNRYVMFSDGSIEAETPQGNFRFGSLDELKEFIAAGGETSSRPI